MSHLGHKLVIHLDQNADPSELLENFILKYKDQIEFIIERFEGQEQLFLTCKNDQIGFLFGRQKLSYVDWTDAALLKRFAQTSTKEIFIQALTSKRTKYKVLWDMTAGFGTDSFIASRYFEEVIMVERNPLVFLLLQDGLRRALLHDKAVKFASKVTLLCAEAQDVLLEWQKSSSTHANPLSISSPDVVFFDFMFENKKTQSSKLMELLRVLEMEYQKVFLTHSNISDLIENALKIQNISRVVLKAKVLPSEIRKNPTQVFAGKVVNYFQF